MNLRRTKRQSNAGEAQGQSTIEFALVCGLLLMPLLVFLADVARAFSEHVVVVQAANLGARWGTLTPEQQCQSGYGSVEEVVIASLTANNIGYKDIGPIPVVLGDQQALTVMVTYTHELLFGWAPISSMLTAQSTMPGPASVTLIQTVCPTNSPTPALTFTPAPTPTVCAEFVNGSAHVWLTGSQDQRQWTAQVTLAGYIVGDRVKAFLCNANGICNRSQVMQANTSTGVFTFTPVGFTGIDDYVLVKFKFLSNPNRQTCLPILDGDGNVIHSPP